MYERPASPPMQWLLNLLNQDFLSDAAIPVLDQLSDAQRETVKRWTAKDVAAGKITKERAQAEAALRDGPPAMMDAAERAEYERLQRWLVQYLAPVLVTDPGPVAEQRRAMFDALLHQAERRGWSEMRENLRRWLAQPQDVIEATLQRERARGLSELASELTEWAENEKVHPQWWVGECPLNQPLSVPAKRRYRSGATVVTVRQELACLPTPKNFMMLNLGACLVRGELNYLRVCVAGECGRYTYVKDYRTIHCSRACYERRDKVRARGRKKRSSLNQRVQGVTESILKGYARVTIPKLTIRMVRALRKQRVLNYNEGEVLDGLREQFEDGIPFDQIWKQSRPGSSVIFTKLKNAGAV